MSNNAAKTYGTFRVSYQPTLCDMKLTLIGYYKGYLHEIALNLAKDYLGKMLYFEKIDINEVNGIEEDAVQTAYVNTVYLCPVIGEYYHKHDDVADSISDFEGISAQPGEFPLGCHTRMVDERYIKIVNTKTLDTEAIEKEKIRAIIRLLSTDEIELLEKYNILDLNAMD